METVNSSIKINDLYDTMGNVSTNMEKIIAIIDQMNSNYFGSRSNPGINDFLVWRNNSHGVPTTDLEKLSYAWMIDYSRVRSFVEIIEDYVKISKDVLDVKRGNAVTGNSKGTT